MNRVQARAVEVCGVAVVAMAAALVAMLGGADLRALHVVGLIVAASMFIAANVQTRQAVAGAALGGVLFGVWWIGAHAARGVGSGLGGGLGSGAGSALWLADAALGLGLVAAAGCVGVVALRHRSPEAESGSDAA